MTRIPIDDGSEQTPFDGDELIEEADAAAAPQSSAPPRAGGADPLASLKAERDDLYNRLARATADFKNSQKRLEADFEARSQYANQSLIKSLLPVIDNFERALAVDPAKVDAAAILKGLQLVHDQWISVLKQQKVVEVAPAPGTPFDVKEGMEAVMQQPPPPELAGKGQVVTQLFAKGYKLGDRILRPAQVAVSTTA
jgi:molecular chaperone GrpE